MRPQNDVAGKRMKHTIIAALLASTGCGLFGGDTTPEKLRDDANAFRARLNAAHDRIVGGYDLAHLVCETVHEPALLTPCTTLDNGVRALDVAYVNARDALDLYESGLAAAEAVELLVAKHERAGDGVGSISDEVVAYAKVVADVARRCGQPAPAEGGQPGTAAQDSGAAADAETDAQAPAATPAATETRP
jgi:hypothetical protein